MGLIITLFIIAVAGVIVVYILSNKKTSGETPEAAVPEFVEKKEEAPPVPVEEKKEETPPSSAPEAEEKPKEEQPGSPGF